MAVKDKLQLVAPELDALPTERVDGVIELAEDQVGQVFGRNRDLAVAYLAAHMLTVGLREGSGGAIASKKEGDLQVQFQGPPDTAGLAATSYGQEYGRLKRLHVFTPRTRVS